MASIKENNLELNYGWPYGESGWNSGMDENIVKLGFESRKRINGILSSPPSSPSNGDAYLVGTTPTGLFSGKFANIAIYDRSSWIFIVPKNQEVVFNASNGCDYIYNNGWSLKLEEEVTPYIKVKDFTFSTGYTITDQRQCLLNIVDNHYYQWGGTLPKTVPAGSTPSTAGVVGVGAWSDRTDVTLRSELSSTGGVGLITGFNFICAEAYSGVDDTAIIQAAINDAISKNIKFIVFNRDYSVSTLTNRQEVIFVGTHKITGDGAYRLRIIDGTEAASITDFGINASAQLTKFASKSAPVVVVIGDSLTTYEPNTIDSQHTMYAALMRKIKSDNPGRTITFYNRGIGGSVWYEIDTAAVQNWPDWYTNHATPWLDYVSALNPDLVIVAAGMNDGGDVNINNISSVITKVKAFASAPDVVCITTPVPSTSPGGTYDAVFGAKYWQEGRDYAAGAVRSVCAYMGVPVIDANRQSNAIRDGFDILESSSIAVINPVLSGGAYLSDIECRNWSATINLNNPHTYTAQPPLAVKVGPSSTDVVFIKAAVSGNIKLELYNKNSSGAPYEIYEVPNQAIPSTAHQLRIEIYNQTIRVFIVGTSTDYRPSPKKMKVGGGLYFPGVGSFESGFTSGYLNDISMFSYGVHKKLIPRLTNNELWGVGDGAANTKYPTGGNGINHPTALGSVCLYQDLINKSNFTVSPNPNEVVITPVVDGGYETVGGRVTRVWGRYYEGTLAARIDKRITWPVSVPAGTYNFIVSGGINAEDLDGVVGMREAQTLVCAGKPNQEGVDVTIFCLTQVGFGRYFDWELLIS